MNKTISKAKCIEAVKTEPLRGGHWVQSFELRPDSQRNCSVCAVGAVLRKAGCDDYSMDEVASRLVVLALAYSHNAAREIRKALKEKRHLDALSMYFESLANPQDPGATLSPILEGKNLSRIRSKLVKFIDKNFPKRIELPLD